MAPRASWSCEAGFANFHLNPKTEVHFKNGDRAPLLIIGAEKDQTVPASLAKKQFEKYEKSDAQTDYAEFEGRPHLMMTADGWEEIAGRIETWIEGGKARRPRRSRARRPETPDRFEFTIRSPDRHQHCAPGAGEAGHYGVAGWRKS